MLELKKLRRLPKGADLSHIHLDLRDKAVPITALSGHPDNPRKHPDANKQAIAGSLRKYLQRKPVVANMTSEGLRIEAGHGVYAEMLAAGAQYIACTIVEDDPVTELGFMLADNRTGDLSEDDPEKLAPILRQLIEAGEDVEEIGWDETAVRELLGNEEEDQGGDDSSPDDDTPVNRADELQKEWKTERGQVWEIPSNSVPGKCHRVMCGDCTDDRVITLLMGTEQATLAWLDPPFGIALTPQRQKTKAIANDGNIEARDLWARFLPVLDAILVDPSHVFLCQQWTEFDWTLPLVRKVFRLKSKVVWNKNMWGLGYYTRPKHEDILYCWKGEPPTIDEPVADVWDIKRENAPIHAAEKPPELSGVAIQHFSQRGAIVVDMFSGVGGVLIACERAGRLARCVELDPAFIAVTLERAKTAGLEPRLVNV